MVCICVTLLLLSGCQAKKKVVVVEQAPPPAQARLVPPPARDAQIQQMMAQAAAGGDVQLTLAGLERLMRQGSAAQQQEAAFRRVELMLDRMLPGAFNEARQVMARYPDHALIPYADLWLAKSWLMLDDNDRALTLMRAALQHPKLTRELLDQLLAQGAPAAERASESVAVSWYLAAADADEHGRDHWLQLAARRASLHTVQAVMQSGAMADTLLPAFAREAAHIRWLRGDTAAIGRIADLLAARLPQSDQLPQLRAWAAQQRALATVGVMLPLSGQYARFGEQALRGLRTALAGLHYSVKLRIEDTASTADGAEQAYRHLADSAVDMVVGPLLAASVQAILPIMNDTLPVIAMTGRTDLAAGSPALFIHTLSPLAQVGMMAQYAWQHGAQKMVIISDAGSSQTEAAMFQQAFEALGGEVMQHLQLADGTLDYRDQLRQLRYETDDDQMLQQLDEDLDLFLPEMDMELRMPVSFDALYLALRGEQVALLAGQLAYADITAVPLYGSSRWQDGHLLDDHGRYLSQARFAVSDGGADADGAQDAQQLRMTYREVWGDDAPTALTRLAYDTMRIAAALSSRYGSDGEAMLQALHDVEGFPAMTGHVQFDADGVGQKKMELFSIHKGEMVPAG